MQDNDHLNDQEIRLEILRIVKENGTEYQKNNPLIIANEYYKWVKGKTIPKKNLTDKRE
jgi:hypothetical protein